MRLFVKLIFAALVIAILLPFTVLKGKDGRPLMSFKDLKMPQIAMPSMPKQVELPDVLEKPAGQDLVYQWRDAEGSLNFTSQPPPAGIEYTVKGYDPRTNLIQSVKLNEEDAADNSTADSEQNSAAQVEKASDIGNPYSPEKIEKLFNDAKNVEKLLNDRLKQQEAMIGQ